MDAINAKKMLYCKFCDYKCSRKSDYERHVLTKKHLKNASKKACKTRKTRTIVEYSCKFCGTSYKHQPSLSRHLKKCKSVEIESVEKCYIHAKTQKNANKKNQEIEEENQEEYLEKDLEIKELKIQLLEEKLKHKDQIKKSLGNSIEIKDAMIINTD